MGNNEFLNLAIQEKMHHIRDYKKSQRTAIYKTF